MNASSLVVNAIETLRQLPWGARFAYNGRTYSLLVGHGEPDAIGRHRTSWADVDAKQALAPSLPLRVPVSSDTAQFASYITIRPEKTIEVLP